MPGIRGANSPLGRYDEVLGGEIARLIVERRDTGYSLRQIAAEVSDKYMSCNHATIRNFLLRLEHE